jgi:hypothetical protein
MRTYNNALNKCRSKLGESSVLLWTTGLLALALLASKKRDHAANHIILTPLGR